MRKGLVIIILVLCSPVALFAQSEMLPVRVDQFYNNYFLVNPASIGQQTDIEFAIGEKALTGDFDGVNTTYANANVSLYDHQKTYPVKSTLGLKFINDKEGQYIGRNWGSLLYAIHIPIRSSLTFGAGLAAGFANIYYKGSNISAGGSSFAPNVDAGIWLQHKKFNLGLAINQLAQSKLQPLDLQYTLRQGWYFTADYKFDINYNFNIKPAVMYRYAGFDYQDLDLAVITELQKVFLVGATYRYDKGFSVACGVDNLQIVGNRFRLLVSYYSPLKSGTTLNTHTAELTLNYFISRGKKESQEVIEE